MGTEGGISKQQHHARKDYLEWGWLVTELRDVIAERPGITGEEMFQLFRERALAARAALAAVSPDDWVLKSWPDLEDTEPSYWFTEGYSVGYYECREYELADLPGDEARAEYQRGLAAGEAALRAEGAP